MLQRSFHCPVLERACHRGNDAPYCWTYLDSQSCHDFPHSLAVDSVKGLCQVYKLYVEISILFLTLFLELPCSKRHHVGSFTALPEAIRTLWEVAIGWRRFLQGSFQRWLSEESLRDCRTIACFTFTYRGGQWRLPWGLEEWLPSAIWTGKSSANLRNRTGPPALKTSSGMESDPGFFLLKFFRKSTKDLFYPY